jgi:transglutaminase-like putative cysteine protease
VSKPFLRWIGILLGLTLISCQAGPTPPSSTTAPVAQSSTVVPTATAMPTATVTPTATSTATPTPTQTATPSPTVTPVPTPVPTPTQTTASRYLMTYEIEHPTVLGKDVLVDQLWLPLPNTDGDGTRDLDLLQVYPPGYQVLDIGEANQAAYWENVPDLCQQTDCRFGIQFRVTLDRPMYAIPWGDDTPYDTESELFKTYTQPQRGIESDDPELRELARQIVGDETDPFRRVLLLQSWLQRNIR